MVAWGSMRRRCRGGEGGGIEKGLGQEREGGCEVRGEGGEVGSGYAGFVMVGVKDIW